MDKSGLVPCLTCQSLDTRNGSRKGGGKKGGQSLPMFVLNTLLKFPKEECESLIKGTGLKRGDWFVLCKPCGEVVNNAVKVHQQIVKLERQLSTFRGEVECHLRQSFGTQDESGRGDGANARRLVRDYLKRSLQNDTRRLVNNISTPRALKTEVHQQFIAVDEYPCHFVEAVSSPPQNEASTSACVTANSSGVMYTTGNSPGDMSIYFQGVQLPSGPPQQFARPGLPGVIPPPTVYKCQQCQFQTDSYSLLYDHLNRHKVQASAPAPPPPVSAAAAAGPAPRSRGDMISCDYCPRMDEKKRIYKHMKEAHAAQLGGKLLNCHHCERTFLSPHGLQVHIRNCHSSTVDGTNVTKHTKKLICSHCGLRVPNDKTLKLHMRQVHAQMYKYLCELCHAMYKSPSGLKAHMGVVHSKEKKKCQYCHIEFGCDKYLRDHLTRYCKKVTWTRK